MEKIWQRDYDEDVPKTVEFSDQTLVQLFNETAEKYPKNTALIYFGRRLSYRELGSLADRFTKTLTELRIGPNDRVVLHLPNIPQFVICYLGILKRGAIAVPINPTYKGEDLRHVLKDSGARVVITITKFLKEVEQAKKGTRLEHVIVTNVKDYLPLHLNILFTLFKEWREGHLLVRKTGGVLSLKSLLKRTRADRVYDFSFGPNKIAIVQYTGGTTGRPKGVVLTHRNLVSNIFQLKSWLPDFKEGKEMVIAVLPFFHIYALSTILNNVIATGSGMILFPEPDLKGILKAINKYKATIMPGVPILYQRLLDEPLIHKLDISSLRFCVSGAAPLDVEIQRKFEELTGAKLVEGYGLTEASPATHANPIYGKRRKGSIGLPLPSTDVKIIDSDTGEELGPNEEGELLICGPQVMKGYWDDREATAKAIRGGWLHTGDVAYYDEDGYFYIIDRQKDMIFIKGSGQKVYPSEVEEVIARHSLVKEVVVVAWRDSQGNEVPKAFVVLEDQEFAEPKLSEGYVQETINRLKRFCEKELAPYKVPREIEIVDEIPKTLIGKPLRRVLREKQES